MLALAFCSPASAADAQDQITTLNGESRSAQVTGFSDSGEVVLGDGSKIPAADLRTIRREVPAVDVSAAVEMTLVSGERIIASEIELKGERVTGQAWGRDFDLKLEALRSVRWKPDEPVIPSFQSPPGNQQNDTLYVRVDGKPVGLAGFVQSFSAATVSFEVEGANRNVPREKLYGLLFAGVGSPPESPPDSVQVELADHGVLSGQIVGMQAGPAAEQRLEIRTSGETTWSVPWGLVSRVQFSSARLKFLSDMTPSNVLERSIAGTKRPFRRDGSILGGPLRLAGRTFDKGLGLQSLTRLTYDLDLPFVTFTALVGVDPAAAKNADCLVTIRGDDRELFKARVRAGEESQQVRIDVRGVKQLVLAVEPGANLDFADQTVWADALLLRE